MKEEKPLHVRVAEALGWATTGYKYRYATSEDHEEWWYGRPPDGASFGEPRPVPRFDTDWSATGPLIEKYAIALDPGPIAWRAGWARGPYDHVNDWWKLSEHAPTPILAACYLILALKEAGKL